MNWPAFYHCDRVPSKHAFTTHPNGEAPVRSQTSLPWPVTNNMRDSEDYGGARACLEQL